MVVNYYLIRKKKLNMDNLYATDRPYKGVNWEGIIGMLIGVVFGALVLEISWYLSLIPAGVSCYFLMKYFGKKNSPLVPKDFVNKES